MKKVFMFVSIIVLLSFLAACGGGGNGDNGADNETDAPDANTAEETEGDTYNFDYAHAGAETHTTHLGAVKFTELVEEKSDGRITFTMYPNRQLGDEREILENVINGTIDMSSTSTGVLSGYNSSFEALQLPFLLNTYDIQKEAYKTDAMQNLFDSLEELGLKGFGPHDLGIRHLANNERPIKTPEDLNGIKLRTVEAPIMTDIFNALGASPTPMAYGEVYTALETGVIDGEEINLTSIVAEKHLEVLEHVTLTGQFPFPAVILINQEVFNSLSEEDQQIMIEAAEETTDYMLEEIKKIDEEALAEIKEAGVEVTELSDDELEAFIDATESVYEKYTEKDPLIADFVNEVQNLK